MRFSFSLITLSTIVITHRHRAGYAYPTYPLRPAAREDRGCSTQGRLHLRLGKNTQPQSTCKTSRIELTRCSRGEYHICDFQYSFRVLLASLDHRPWIVHVIKRGTRPKDDGPHFADHSRTGRYGNRGCHDIGAMVKENDFLTSTLRESYQMPCQ